MDTELLDKQSNYKEYFYNCLFTGWFSTLVKLFIAFLFSLIFDLFELFINYNFLVSYVIVEVLNYNLFINRELKP